MKILEKILIDKFKSENLDLKNKINNLDQNIKTSEIKIKEIGTKITEDNSIEEKLRVLIMLKINYQINSLDMEIRQLIINMNNTLRETVVYACVIGPFANLKHFMNSLILL